MSYYSTVSTELAIALSTLPRITAADLYERCKDKIGNVTLAQFRPELAKWISDGTIPGYESRKGPNGGLYKIGAPGESLAKKATVVIPEIDPAPIALALAGLLEVQTHITSSALYALCDLSISEFDFKPLLSKWLKDGTIPGYEVKMGKTGGIYKVGAELDKWSPTNSVEDMDETTEEFTLQVSPTIRIIRSDERNWVIQKKGGENWVNKYYHPTIKSAINSVVRHIMNGEFKLADSTVVQLKESLSFLKGLEGRIEAQITKHMTTV